MYHHSSSSSKSKKELWKEQELRQHQGHLLQEQNPFSPEATSEPNNLYFFYFPYVNFQIPCDRPSDLLISWLREDKIFSQCKEEKNTWNTAVGVPKIKERYCYQEKSQDEGSSTDVNDKRAAWKRSAEGWTFMSRPKCPGDRTNESRIS